MYFTRKPEDEQEYEEIHVDNRVFYTIKKQTEYKKQTNSIFKLKCTYKRLLLIDSFLSKKDIEKEISLYTRIIHKCLSILEDKYKMDIKKAVKQYNLKSLGISEFNISESSDESNK